MGVPPGGQSCSLGQNDLKKIEEEEEGDGGGHTAPLVVRVR